MLKRIDSLNVWVPHQPDHPWYQPLFDEVDDHAGVLSQEEASSISSYLEFFRGKTSVCMSYQHDPLTGKGPIERNGGEDDKYIWTGLTHYLIETHRVDPPLAFREHVKERLVSGIALQAFALEVSQRPQPPRADKLRSINEPRPPAPSIEEGYLLYP